MTRLLPIIALLVLAPVADACTVCVTTPLKAAFQDSRLFFVGRVLSNGPWTVTFEVIEQFKGERARKVTLDTSSSCSISRFELGASYLVEATANDGRLFAYLCSHTGALDDPATRRKLALVKRRASWWQSPFSRFSLYRFRQLAGRV